MAAEGDDVGGAAGVALAVLGGWLLVGASVHLWLTRAYATSTRIGWQLVIVGLVVGPLVTLDDGWFVGFPLGALAYLLFAAHGPVRGRRAARDGEAPATPDEADPET